MRKPVILDKHGKPIVLTNAEKTRAARLQRKVDDEIRLDNSIGTEVDITTLTTVVKKVSEQKFFRINPSDYIPIVVGNGAFGTQLTTFRSFDVAGDFETGFIDLGSDDTRLASATGGVDAVTVKIKNWAKRIGWSLFEVGQASVTGNWDVVTAKEQARKRNWDLGIQKIAFLGARGSERFVPGLLNMPNVTVDSSTISSPISLMTPTELKAFVVKLMAEYRKNAAHTDYPDTFVLPEFDYNGLVGQASPNYPVISTLKLLLDAFKEVTMNPGFRILPAAYANASLHAGYAGIEGQDVYALYRYDETSLRMDVPVPYTTTLANSVDNFMLHSVGYGQFTGVHAYRENEALYFHLPASSGSQAN